ncbi:MAG: DMT family transporter [Ginsengibacter sp.]
MTSQTKAHLALLGTNLFFASNYSAIKYFTAHHYSGPFGINIIRIGVSLILFWILFLFKPVKNRVTKKDIPIFLLCALTAIALNQMFFIKGLSLTLAIHASLLTLITPILITVIAAYVLKERLNSAKMIGLLLGISGAVLLISFREAGAQGDNIPFGDSLVILSSVAYTFYFILVKPLMSRYSPIMVTRLIFTFGFFMILPVCFQEFSEISWSAFSIREWLLLFIIVVPGTFFAYIFNVYGIKILSASTAGAYIYSQPIFAAIIAIIFLGESLSFYKIIAGALIFMGVFLSNKRKKRVLKK